MNRCSGVPLQALGLNYSSITVTGQLVKDRGWGGLGKAGGTYLEDNHLHKCSALREMEVPFSEFPPRCAFDCKLPLSF